MIIYRFGREDLLRTRFAISPLFEVNASLSALRDPASSSIHVPWVREARTRLEGVDLSMLHALVPGTGYHPDFVAPVPDSPLPDVAEEIERVRATPAATVRREVGWLYEGSTPPPEIRLLLDQPRRGLRLLAGSIAAYWERAIAPFWERILAVLEDDIAHRARLLTAGGAIEVFGDLHPDVAWRDGSLTVERPVDADVDLRGRGLLMVPSVFIWPRSGAAFDEPWQPALLYPPRGVGDLWAPPRRDDRALAGLLGARRAMLLSSLDREATTTALARRHGASPAGVSEHLAVLRGAGLVRARRQGREVLYARTALGDQLVRT